ncbi:MAG: hypothetical protein E6G46_07730 [Actinobacteria bacterium]|nr:MAG: hypothetical protein E6G46_07730 [Actinomycetota bacterium]
MEPALDARAHDVEDGQGRQLDRPALLPTPAGKVMELWVEINPATALIAAGHTLRLAIQQTDTPHLAPSIPEQMSILGNMLTILHDPAHPSAVVLPLER